MRAAVLIPDGANGSIEVREVPDPSPGPGQIRIAVHAAGLNRADLLQRAGRYGAGPVALEPVIGGSDAAGTVTALGAEVTGITVGDRVMGICAGAYAQAAVMDARVALPVPDSLSWEQAAALPVALMTELDALVNAAALVTGESVLVTAAGSGVGAIGVQVARVLGAGTVLATARSDKSADAARAAGADDVLDGNDPPEVTNAARAATSCQGVDIIVDHVGAELFDANIAALALGGRLVSVGRLGGQTATIDLNQVALRRLRLIGTTFRTRNLDERAAIADQVREQLLATVGAGAIRAHVSATYPLEDVLRAQEDLRHHRYPGKLVLHIEER
ncbi:MAG: zinc-binding dehydrogenase [Mycobacterium sp.]